MIAKRMGSENLANFRCAEKYRGFDKVWQSVENGSSEDQILGREPRYKFQNAAPECTNRSGECVASRAKRADTQPMLCREARWHTAGLFEAAKRPSMIRNTACISAAAYVCEGLSCCAPCCVT